jgi:hypothetical protein
MWFKQKGGGSLETVQRQLTRKALTVLTSAGWKEWLV